MTLKNICPMISTLIFRFGKEPIDRARLDLVFLFYLFQQIEVKRYFFRFENYVTVPESCPRGLGRLLCRSLAKSDVHTCVFFTVNAFTFRGLIALNFFPCVPQKFVHSISGLFPLEKCFWVTLHSFFKILEEFSLFLGKKPNMIYFASFTYFCTDPKLWMTLKNIIVQ